MKSFIIPLKITLLTLGLLIVLYAMYFLNTRGLSNTTKVVLGLSGQPSTTTKMPERTEMRKAKVLTDEACGVDEAKDSASCDNSE